MITYKDLINAKPRDKDYILCDGRGLYLKICKSGRRVWYYRYYQHGHDRKVTIGEYPRLSLSQAREKCDQIRAVRHKRLSAKSVGRTFADVASEWLKYRLDHLGLSHKHLTTVDQRVKSYLLPTIGHQSMETITRKQLNDLLIAMCDRGVVHTAHIVAGIIFQIYKFAVDQGYLDIDAELVAHKLTRQLPQKKSQHFATTTIPHEIGAIMRSIACYTGSVTVRLGLCFTAYTIARSGEVRHARWGEIDKQNALWVKPPEHTKGRKVHRVPLSRQALAILDQVQPLTYNGPDSLIFRRVNTRGRKNTHGGVLSDSALLRPLRVAAKKSGGKTPKITVHGFRSMCSSILHEHRYGDELVERQLSHAYGSKIADAYNRSERIEDRREMMQHWADWLDAQRDNDANVT